MRDSKPTIYDPSFLPNHIYSGVPSWLNLPVLEEVQELAGWDAIISGVPWEGGCTLGGYSSCTQGPKAIRSVSIRYTGFLPEFQLDAFDHLKVADFGDVPCGNGDYDLTFSNIRRRTREIADAGAFPITFGGDHSISYPILSELAQRHPGRIGILHFDAHLDNYASFGSDTRSRCSPFYQLYQDPNINPAHIVHIGIRGPRNHREEFENVSRFGANLILARDIREEGWKPSIHRAIQWAFQDTDLVYITVCADVLDAAFMPQGPQDMCGLSSYELCMMVHEAGLAGARGFDFVELYPDLFSHQTAAHAACWTTLYYLNGLAQWKRDGHPLKAPSSKVPPLEGIGQP